MNQIENPSKRNQDKSVEAPKNSRQNLKLIIRAGLQMRIDLTVYWANWTNRNQSVSHGLIGVVEVVVSGFRAPFC